ncbi:hypothetical protein ACO1O0_007517 [Amphichorda felina]
MTAFNIKIVSDNVCPYCYLGKVRLDRAIAQFRRDSSPSSPDTFNISWHAYMLDPSAPEGVSEPVQVTTARKFGPARAAAMQQRLRQVGAAEGLDFTFAGRRGSTRDSHRVVQLAKAKAKAKAIAGDGDVEDRVVHEIMKMYFEAGGDVTAEEDLVRAAARAGVDAEETRAWLRGGKGGGEVDREVEEAYEMGVTGVPHFIINDKFEVHGAEDVSVFLKQLNKAREAAA